MAVSPSTDNYQIGKGIVSFSTDDGVTFRDLGDVSVFEWTPTIEKLDHFSSRSGVKTKDKSVAITVAATLKVTMSEITAANLALMALGTVDTDTAGNSLIKSLDLSEVEGIIKFVGTNDVGLKVNFIGKVSFVPSGSFNPISEEWNTLEVTGEMVTTDAYGLGLWTVEDVTAE